MIKMETREELITEGKRSKRRIHLPTSSGAGGEEFEEEEDMANCLILLAQGCNNMPSPEEFIRETQPNIQILVPSLYQCKTCSKRFPSFQALGGHRAGHKKPKHSSLNVDELIEEESSMLSLGRVFSCNNTKQRVHECSICGTGFSSGQALGGHMRRHRPIPILPLPTSNNKEEEFPSQLVQSKKQTTLLALDLNLPAPDEHQDDQIAATFDYFPTKQLIVFSTSPLIHCHY